MVGDGRAPVFDDVGMMRISHLVAYVPLAILSPSLIRQVRPVPSGSALNSGP